MKVRKKALIITYYWPPAGGPGVQRWLKFTKYLPKFDIEPIIYCPENPNYPIIDQSLVNEVNKDITIVKRPINEPYRFAKLLSGQASKQISSGVIPERRKQSFVQKLMLYIRGNFYIPDARKNWIKPSVSFLSEYISAQHIDTIITTGPPHSMHLIGLQLKAKMNLKWIADFRDPWTTIGYHKALKLTSSSAKKHINLESQVLRLADHIIVTSNNTKQEFLSKTEQPISVITNGYDYHQIPKPQKDEKFSLVHIGSLLSKRNPLLLWEALADLVKGNSAFSEAFELVFYGVVSEDVIQTLNSFGLSEFVHLKGYVSHHEAITAQMSARVLVLIEINSEDTKQIIPGKLFEYMVSETPILAIGPEDSDVESIIKKTNTGSYFYYNQKNAIKSEILSYFEAYKNNSLTVNAVGLQQYSRETLAKSLSDLLKS